MTREEMSHLAAVLVLNVTRGRREVTLDSQLHGLRLVVVTEVNLSTLLTTEVLEQTSELREYSSSAIKDAHPRLH